MLGKSVKYTTAAIPMALSSRSHPQGLPRHDCGSIIYYTSYDSPVDGFESTEYHWAQLDELPRAPLGRHRTWPGVIRRLLYMTMTHLKEPGSTT